MGSKPLQSSKNGATVPTLWDEPLRGETALAASTPWLKFGKIGVRAIQLSFLFQTDTRVLISVSAQVLHKGNFSLPFDL